MKKTFTLNVYSKPMEFSKDEFAFTSYIWREDYQWENFIKPFENIAEYQADREYIVKGLQNFIDIYEKGYIDAKQNFGTNSDTNLDMFCDPESPF